MTHTEYKRNSLEIAALFTHIKVQGKYLLVVQDVQVFFLLALLALCGRRQVKVLGAPVSHLPWLVSGPQLT